MLFFRRIFMLFNLHRIQLRPLSHILFLKMTDYFVFMNIAEHEATAFYLLVMV